MPPVLLLLESCVSSRSCKVIALYFLSCRSSAWVRGNLMKSAIMDCSYLAKSLKR